MSDEYGTGNRVNAVNAYISLLFRLGGVTCAAFTDVLLALEVLDGFTTCLIGVDLLLGL